MNEEKEKTPRKRAAKKNAAKPKVQAKPENRGGQAAKPRSPAKAGSKLDLTTKTSSKEFVNLFVDDGSYKDLESSHIKYIHVESEPRVADVGLVSCHYCQAELEKSLMTRTTIDAVAKQFVFVCNDCTGQGKTYVNVKATCHGCKNTFNCDTLLVVGKKKNEIFCDECGGM